MFTITYTINGTEAAEPCRHATTARARALAAAAETNHNVVVSRAGKPAYSVTPAGHILPPEGAQTAPREDCKRALGTDGPCFCSSCRAERRAERRERRRA